MGGGWVGWEVGGEKWGLGSGGWVKGWGVKGWRVEGGKMCG